jgi:hypothetical protein
VYSPVPPALPDPGLRALLAADVERYLRNAIRFEGMLVESASLLAVALAALGVLAWLRPPRRAARGILPCAFAPLLICPFFMVEPKWLEPSMPLLFVLTAEGIVLLASLVPDRRRWLVTGGITALLVLRWSPLLAFPIRYTPAFEEVEQRWAASSGVRGDQPGHDGEVVGGHRGQQQREQRVDETRRPRDLRGQHAHEGHRRERPLAGVEEHIVAVKREQDQVEAQPEREPDDGRAVTA